MISREGSGVLKLMERRKEMQLLVVEGLLKNSRNQRRNGRESTRAGRKKPERQQTQRSPSGGDPAARNNTMEMGMKKQVLSPTVQYGEEADLGAQMFGIGGNGA